jgi:hypothetical protein
MGVGLCSAGRSRTLTRRDSGLSLGQCAAKAQCADFALATVLKFGTDRLGRVTAGTLCPIDSSISSSSLLNWGVRRERGVTNCCPRATNARAYTSLYRYWS